MASPFRLWSTLGPFFTNSAGPLDGEDWALSNATDGGTPIWVDTMAPAPNYLPGGVNINNYLPNGVNSYSIVMATQDFLGDIQPIAPAISFSMVDPFGSTAAPFGNLAAAAIFSATSTSGTGGLIYWAPSATPGEYSVQFRPLTVTYPSATTAPLTQFTGNAVTMIPAIANPTSWEFLSRNASSFVFGYSTAASSTTENLYFEGFNTSGGATSAGPALIATLPTNTPYFVGANGSGYLYRYLEVGGALGTGLVGGTFDPSTNTLGAPSLIQAMPNYTAFSGVSVFAMSDGNSVRLVEGVENGDDVIQSFLSGSATAKATFHLASADDYWRATSVYDPSTGHLDYTVLAYTDAGQVHLELLDDNGVQIGTDYVIPGISSFDHIHTLTSTVAGQSTRVEIDYTVADPNGGTEVEGFIYDTASAGQTYVLSGGGLRAGTTFDDTFDWGAGVYTIDGGGGNDTLVATSLSTSQVTFGADGAGQVTLDDGMGDVDTLRRIQTIQLADARVSIGFEQGVAGLFTHISENFSDFSSKSLTFTPSGDLLSVADYNSSGKLTGIVYASQSPNQFTGGVRSDILFQTVAGASAGSLAAWHVDDTTITGGGTIGSPGAGWTYEGNGDFYGNGYNDILWRNQNGELAIWEMNGTSVVGGGNIGNPGGTWSVVGVGDFYGNGYCDILFRDASGNLAEWEMNGTKIVAAGKIGNPGANYRLVGIGDFNQHDGAGDLLFESTSGQYAIWNLSGSMIVGGATLGSPGAGWVYKGIGNFNGLGDSDILFENVNTGVYATWNVSDDAITGGGNIGSPGSSWTFAATGDYTSNGKSDILFRNVLTGQYATWDLNNTSIVGGGAIGNPGAGYALARGAPAALPEPAPTLVFRSSTGSLATWEISNGAISGGGALGNPGAGWTALAVGDFYGDGQSDVLFENASGLYASWRTNGVSITGGGNIGSASGYTFKGLGDFNGDGISDLLFENASGSYATWEMNGTSIIGGATLGNPGPGFTFEGTGDFNGDGTSDVLFADSSGNYWIWFINNDGVAASAKIGNPGSGWTLKGIGDLNGDGKSDLLFENASGTYASWDLDNGKIIGGGTIGNPGSQWAYAGIADLNAAGHASIVFDNTATGQVATWLINDTTIAGGATLGTASGFTLLATR